MITRTTYAGCHPAQTHTPRTATTRADARPDAAPDRGTSAASTTERIPVSALKALDTAGLKIVRVEDVPELRDGIAKMWLEMQAALERLATDVPDNAPQNTYATVKVNGKVVATLYNSGCSEMSNAAAATVGDLQDPPGLGGPDLAQWRANRIATALGGTIEKASSAIAQSEWKPRESISTDYTRAQLDAAFQAKMAERQAASARGGTSMRV